MEKAHLEFHGRLVVQDYPARHAEAQQVTFYDYVDGVSHDRIRYGAAQDRYPGGITYATREERITYRIKSRQEALDKLFIEAGEERITLERYHEEFARIDCWFPHKDDPNDLIGPDEVIRTDHRCPDCDVEVGEFHLLGCDVEVCPRCNWQSISCDCPASTDEDSTEAEDEDNGICSVFAQSIRRIWQNAKQRIRKIWWHIRYRAPREIVIYVREHGSDTEGTGTLACPYKTFQRAKRAVPSFIPPYTSYTIDNTGTTTYIDKML